MSVHVVRRRVMHGAGVCPFEAKGRRPGEYPWLCGTFGSIVDGLE